MNRIILIGNGFDLAHGLPTSYKNFIDNYWANFINNFQGKSFYENEDFRFENISIGWSFFEQEKNFDVLKDKIKLSGAKLIFKNHFLGYISNKNSLNNWVDIENEYYRELINLKNKKPEIYIGTSKSIEDLNIEFNRVKLLLIEYLKEVNVNFKDKLTNNFGLSFRIGKKIYSPINLKDINENGINILIDSIIYELNEYEISNEKVEENFVVNIDYLIKNLKENSKKNIKKILIDEKNVDNFNLIPTNTLILSFNYTTTHYLYDYPNKFDDNRKKITKSTDIQIHGTINRNNENPVIFGYGDELDEDYLNIEKLNDNRFLENIKSIKYSETANYKKTLEFLDSDLYQIFIMGHSCGTSDRTLLNTLFEHKNCTSIKVFYHDKGNDGDNFSDLVRNISRNFNDKIKMRDRLVNKSYSEPL